MQKVLCPVTGSMHLWQTVKICHLSCEPAKNCLLLGKLYSSFSDLISWFKAQSHYLSINLVALGMITATTASICDQGELWTKGSSLVPFTTQRKGGLTVIEIQKPVSKLLKRCYEIGQTPVWPLPTLETKAVFRGPAQQSSSNKKHQSEIPALQAGRFQIEGKIENGKNLSYSINGVGFEVTADTFIVGNLALGATAKVQGSYEKGKKVARKIIVQSTPTP